MMTSPSLTLPVPLALAVVLGCMVIAAYLARVRERMRRRHARHERADLRRVLRHVLQERASGAELHREVSRCGPGAFWNVLESLCFRLRYADWLRLSRALEGNRFSRRERRALREESTWRRVLAARRLGLLRSESSRRALRRALAHGPELVSLAALRSLAKAGDRGALRWLLAHPDSVSRRTAQDLTSVLRAFGRGALPDLHEALERGLESRRLERAAIETLGLGRHQVAAVVIERRLVSPDPELRVAAARALGRLSAIECASGLLAALKDESWPVRAQAARALGRAGATLSIPALSQRLSDRSWWVRRHAAYALRELGAEGQAALRRIQETAGDPYARDMAGEALQGGFQRGAA